MHDLLLSLEEADNSVIYIGLHWKKIKCMIYFRGMTIIIKDLLIPKVLEYVNSFSIKLVI